MSSPLHRCSTFTDLAIDGVTFRNSFITAFQTGHCRFRSRTSSSCYPWTYNGSADGDFFHGKNLADTIFRQ